MLLPGGAPAQVLARPGWAGSGVSVEPWWTRALFYRLDVRRFQDSNGDGIGDVAGVTQRLDYLQSLGVDALLLRGLQPESPAGFDELTRAATERHLRVLVELDPSGNPSGKPAAADDAHLLGAARLWLGQGAAGIFFRIGSLTGSADDETRAAGLLRQLRALTNSFPGQRILMADTLTRNSTPEDVALAGALAASAQLIAAPPVVTAGQDAGGLRRQMLFRLGDAASNNGSRGTRPLLRVTLPYAAQPYATQAAAIPAIAAPATAASATMAQAAERQDGLARTIALLLLASRAAVLLESGQELGLLAAKDGSMPLMQWTRDDITHAPPPPAPPAPAPLPDRNEGFHPYVPPLPRTLLPAPTLPEVMLSDAPPPLPPEYRPGFTAAALDPALAAALAPNGATHSVSVEDADPSSVLNLYRRLIQLRNGSTALGGGQQMLLNEDALGALVWMRRAGPGSGGTSSARASTVVAVCNLSAAPLHLALDADLKAARLPTGMMRNLLADQMPARPAQRPMQRTVQSTNDVTVAPDEVFLGELYR